MEILKKREKVVDRRRIGARMGLKCFHEVRKPKISEQKNTEDRLWFADYLSDWTEEHFLNLACSDEFYLYANRKPNSQNDIIWPRSVEDIPDDVRYRMVSADCSSRMLWGICMFHSCENYVCRQRVW